MAGRLSESSSLARLLAGINSTEGAEHVQTALPPPSPLPGSQEIQPHVLNRRKGEHQLGGEAHPEAFDPTHKRHILIGFQSSKPLH